jgi:hypothetical protein
MEIVYAERQNYYFHEMTLCLLVAFEASKHLIAYGHDRKAHIVVHRVLNIQKAVLSFEKSLVTRR